MNLLRKTNVSVISVIMIMILAGCSVQKNTPQSRWWHSFNARYNTYYNGSVAYIDGATEKEKSNKDNFTEMIPLYTVGNKESRKLGEANFTTAIEKCQKAIKIHSIKRRPEWKQGKRKTQKDIEWLNRKEYNPFLWKAWLLMGRSQFMKGDFDEAASTFNYMSRIYSTQPPIYGKARAWLAKCYVEEGWYYDAEDVITKMRRDSIDRRARKEWDYTLADYYIATKRYDEAIPYLKKVIKHEGRRVQRAREYYLLGQIYAIKGNNYDAYRSFKKVVRQNPPYMLEFNARIAMTEVMSGRKPKKMIKKLRRMAASDNNNEYLDQVYYAMGNIYMAEKDTVEAVRAYEKGNVKSTRNGIEKGVLLLRLGDIYWSLEKFNDAQRCYGEAIGLLDKERDDYEQLSERSKVLDELVPSTDAVHLQDSLQMLAKMPEKERNEAIDRVIEALIEKEKEEKRLKDEEIANQKMAEEGGDRNILDRRPNRPESNDKKGLWYFYNPIAVSQGKANFKKRWGKRENEDNWQRSNKSVVATGDVETLAMDALADSLAALDAIEDSLAALEDSAQNDPHKREYYLKEIPFTEEQVQASNEIIKEGLLSAGIIFKDRLDNLPLCEKYLTRLTDSFPDYDRNDEAMYHLYLLYMRKNQPSKAQEYLAKMKASYAESDFTTILSDPYFVENAKYGVHIEDSLYAAAYDAFKKDDFTTVMTNLKMSDDRFPLGANRQKFIFIGGLSKLNSGDSEGCLTAMNEVVEKFPSGRISELAGMIVNGVKDGRQLRGGKFDLEDVWSRRTVVMSDSDSINNQQLSLERNTEFSYVIAYSPDSIDANKLLFQLAKFNFSNFLVRNFDIELTGDDLLAFMKVSGFRNYDEALQYVRMLYDNTAAVKILEKCRTLIISKENIDLVGKQYSYEEYEKFYEEHFVPLKISSEPLLLEPEDVNKVDDNRLGDKKDDKQPAADSDGFNIFEPGKNNTGGAADDGISIPMDGGKKTLDEGAVDDGVSVPLDDKKKSEPVDDGSVSIPVKEEKKETEPVDDGSVSIPVKEEKKETEPVDDGSVSVPVKEEKKEAEPVDDSSVSIPVKEEKKETEPVDEGSVSVSVKEEKKEAEPVDDGSVSVPVKEEKKEAEPVDDGSVSVPVKEEKKELEPVDDGGISIPVKEKKKEETIDESGVSVPVQSEKKKKKELEPVDDGLSIPVEKEKNYENDDTGLTIDLGGGSEDTTKKKDKKEKEDEINIYFGDEEDLTPKDNKDKKDKKKKKQEDDDASYDEYIELEGF